MEQQGGIPVYNPTREDELANILANMGEYGQPLSPSNLQVEEETQEKDALKEVHTEEAEVEISSVHDEKVTENIEQEQPVPSQKAPEESPEEIREEEELAQERTEPSKVLTLEQPPQEENPEISHSPTHNK